MTAASSGCGSPTSNRTRRSDSPTRCSPRSRSSATARLSCISATTCCRAESTTWSPRFARSPPQCAHPAHPGARSSELRRRGAPRRRESSRLVKKPPEPATRPGARRGVHVHRRAIHAAARAISPSARGELEITDAIQQLVDTGQRVEPHIVKGWWKDSGGAVDMLAANRLVLDTIETRIEGRARRLRRSTGRS